MTSYSPAHTRPLVLSELGNAPLGIWARDSMRWRGTSSHSTTSTWMPMSLAIALMQSIAVGVLAHAFTNCAPE